MKSKNVNGVRIFSASSRNDLINHALNNHSILVAVNAEKIMNATDETRKIINSNVGYPDGYGAVLSLKHKGMVNTIKIPGCELWLDIIKRESEKKSFYLVGGSDIVIKETVEKLESEFPYINIVGFRNGYFSNQFEEDKLIENICSLKPDVIFVAMGSPTQEILMQKLSARHSCLYQGLGGSFDVYVGRVKRAPKIWVKLNIEWLYRLIKQPSRITRQFSLFKFLFLLKVLNRY